MLANFKPFTTFAYYMTPDEFKGSIYSRKSGSTDNELTHLQCHNAFKAVFAPAAIEQLLLTMLTSVMACKAIVSSRRDELEEDCLEDTELAVADQVSQPSPYDQCVTYCKHLIKCFRK